MESNEILKNGNSTANQDVKSKLVHRDVYTSFTHEMDLLLRQGWENPQEYPCYEDMENYYSYPEYSGKYYDFEGGTDEEKNYVLEEIADRIETFRIIFDYYDGTENQNMKDKIKDILDSLQSDYDEIEELETEPAEIFEYWAVSNMLAEKLKSHGEVIFEFGCNNYWGRQTTGQAILLDYVITKIAFEMEILEGQENHKYWKD